jgi:plasmid segregation protein ParM
MSNVIGLDIGRNGVKVCAESRLFGFPSIVGEWNVRKLNNFDYGDRGFEIEVDGVKNFIGELAENESDNWRYMLIDNKATEDAKLLALTAIHLSGYQDVTVITGLPVEQHDDDRKKTFRNLLMGPRAGLWDVTVNGQRRIIKIHDIKVAVEGGAAFWSDPRDGLIRLIDAGSKTVNYVTMKDRRYIYRDSGTLPYGFNTKRKGKEINVSEYAKQIAADLGAIKWSATDTVFVSGGRAQELSDHLRQYFPLAVPLPNAVYANAIGYYRAGRATT